MDTDTNTDIDTDTDTNTIAPPENAPDCHHYVVTTLDACEDCTNVRYHVDEATVSADIDLEVGSGLPKAVGMVVESYATNGIIDITDVWPSDPAIHAYIDLPDRNALLEDIERQSLARIVLFVQAHIDDVEPMAESVMELETALDDANDALNRTTHKRNHIARQLLDTDD